MSTKIELNVHKLTEIYSNVESQYLDLKNIISQKIDLDNSENNNANVLFLQVQQKYHEILSGLEIVIKGKDLYNYDFFVIISYVKKIEISLDSFKTTKGYQNILDGLELILSYLSNFDSYIFSILNHETVEEQILKSKEKLDEIDKYSETVQEKLKQANIITEKIQNKSVQDIYTEDSKKFKQVARIYEFAFYILILFLALYFFGYEFHFNTTTINFIFTHHIDYELKTAFYIQKISILILSTTLAAFLLKRSFMNRKLADETYRISKEFDSLPLYMESLTDDVKQKIRTDLAYKYFGNVYDKDGQAINEYLMADQIKATAELTKTTNDLAKIIKGKIE